MRDQVAHWMHDPVALLMLVRVAQLMHGPEVLAMLVPAAHATRAPVVVGIAQPFAADKPKKLATQPQRIIFMFPLFRAMSAGVLILAVQASCIAQTVAQSAVISAKLDKTGMELSQTIINLRQMNDVNLPDSDLISYATDSASGADTSFDKLNVYVSIHSLMVDARDQAMVKRFIPLQAKSALKVADRTLPYINKLLAKLKSQAAILELQKARDLIQTMRDEVQKSIPIPN